MSESREDAPDSTRPPLVAAGSTQGGNDDDEDEDDFDRARRAHLNAAASCSDSSGWRDELTRYLEAVALDVTRDTDTVEWWHVSA